MGLYLVDKNSKETIINENPYLTSLMSKNPLESLMEQKYRRRLFPIKNLLMYGRTLLHPDTFENLIPEKVQAFHRLPPLRHIRLKIAGLRPTTKLEFNLTKLKQQLTSSDLSSKFYTKHCFHTSGETLSKIMKNSCRTKC